MAVISIWTNIINQWSAGDSLAKEWGISQTEHGWGNPISLSKRRLNEQTQEFHSLLDSLKVLPINLQKWMHDIGWNELNCTDSNWTAMSELEVSWNGGTRSSSSIFMGCSLINQPFLGFSYGFPMVFRFSYGFPMVFLWFGVPPFKRLIRGRLSTSLWSPGHAGAADANQRVPLQRRAEGKMNTMEQPSLNIRAIVW